MTKLQFVKSGKEYKVLLGKKKLVKCSKIVQEIISLQ